MKTMNIAADSPHYALEILALQANQVGNKTLKTARIGFGPIDLLIKYAPNIFFWQFGRTKRWTGGLRETAS